METRRKRQKAVAVSDFHRNSARKGLMRKSEGFQNWDEFGARERENEGKRKLLKCDWGRRNGNEGSERNWRSPNTADLEFGEGIGNDLDSDRGYSHVCR
jgi:hypothetical protein